MRRLLAVVLLLGVPRAAGAAAPAPTPAPAKVTAPARAAQGPASAEPPKKPHPFEWNVPGTVSHVDVAGLVEAQGIPMKLNAVESTWMPPELFDFFQKQFLEAGFYLPPPKDQLPVHGAVTLTAMDVERQLVYTVIMRVNSNGKTTKVLLSTSNMALAKKPSDVAFVPVYPGARELVTSNVEVGRMVRYVTSAKPEELNAFYAKVMADAGFKELRPGLYSKDRELVEVKAKPLENGELSVLVMGRIGTEEEFISNPHTD